MEKVFETKFAKIGYVSEDKVVFHEWKMEAHLDDYREPVNYSLKLLRENVGSTFVVDARNGFLDVDEDVEWGFNYFLPELKKTGCKVWAFILPEVSEIEGEIDLWTKEIEKNFTVIRTTSYEEAVKLANFYLYLKPTETIDCDNEKITTKAREIQQQSIDEIDYIKRTFIFVRDSISHSWDVNATIVSKKASEVLENKTGICWTKSCLLAALLRANQIPAGISYQKLTRGYDDSDGYIIHALNVVYVKNLDKWIRLDARGNNENVNTQFDLEKEVIAFPVRDEYNEIDYKDNHYDLDPRLVKILHESENISEVRTDFDL